MNFWSKVIITIVLVVFITLIIILAVVPRCAQKITDHFTNVYTNWSKQLEDMKKTHQIGAPSGLLKYLPNQTECSSSQGPNLLVQSDVAFKPHRRKNGCTYIDLKYPG